YRTDWRRVAPVFTVGYVNDTLVEHAGIAIDLIRLFGLRFDPDGRDGEAADDLVAELIGRLDAIPSIEQDRILRSFLRLIEATLRTNAFVPGRGPLVFKFRSADVPDVPAPRPMVEIFVLGRDVEGIHLRGGMVARGGLRWSTRREDYRTEVLGLMKAQMTKNAVIVPTGAKGGFVLHTLPDDPGEVRTAVETGYRTFVNGLLDVTDNRIGGAVVHPDRVVVRDGEDPYLVVAADKGTASLSDVANGIAAERGFWLADAFASGGSAGYDHKALAITARGAWESLTRHFLEVGLDPETDEFTVVGIGDMSGDVFGNGMLMSDRAKVVAAFDHRHVFIDPDPDPKASFSERRRLFEMPRSSWDDYDRSVISEGGGIFPRSAKHIDLHPAARSALGTDRDGLTPNELISVILRAPVDLLWNGGIGTYVKARHENHDDAGDRANDAVRVNGADLRARVVVEGGNLGLTQAGRIEFARSGGAVNTDFIDNSGGVDCSDREVNLKILLGMAIERGDLDGAERDELIASVASDVVDGILRSNARQAAVLSREVVRCDTRMESYETLMAELEEAGLLDRAVEGLPTSEEMRERAHDGAGLTRPELSVLLAYAKRTLRGQLARGPLSESEDLLGDLHGYFPPPVVERFAHLFADHPLRRELVATLVANEVVNAQGIVFVSRLAGRTDSPASDVVEANRVARDVSGVVARRVEIDSLLPEVGTELWAELIERLESMVASLTRWYVRHARDGGIASRVGRGREAFVALEAALIADSQLWRPAARSRFERLVEAGVPGEVARHQAVVPILASAPDLIEVAAATGRDPVEVLDVFLRSGRTFGLDRLGELAADVTVESSWDRWALWTIEEDLLGLRRFAAEQVLAIAAAHPESAPMQAFIDSRPDAIRRLERFFSTLESVDADVAALTVALRQVRAAIV
ncbi:MAG TPA: NAD-glutamate dehydrogenase domain-containing protein, partial [Acidimicrobiia bacterium]|nr:NAD-glutamate dehydrogenase domain-containing protein [Acidimicrobiia bacterium]